ncbi:MAG TPA: NADH-quinone oxidoreductase subunit NuoG [Casimicrobiaceae bacterium]|jgi:NADH-quinone oxidoreductase subunit G|nr:NADH-quinone oxidoreductase subunit NuoG [Casimicrobiaceae bacterium]
MLTIEIDGKPVELPNGSTVMDGANKLGIYVPHFCWHQKLSIAANCRMCLVQVEKAPKPLPACATPATDGMKVYTQSEQAKKAQQGVMEFLLINHPLDCPICDQGGECQLQDLAVGYGNSSSRYQEEKRVVFHKNLGPLVAAEEMTRCIQCTRCIRFGQEIAGVMELGMAGRGEREEIVTFVGKTVDSELSGNMIDLCPVGALTSKPFRYSARTWELARRKSVSPHDALGSNLVVQVKGDTVKRVLPLENEAINECWLSDRDRFSYEALNSEERLTEPMIRRAGNDGSSTWQAVDWQTALEHVAKGLGDVAHKHGGGALGALCAPHATTEELALTARLMRGLGSDNIDHRLRQSDFRGDGHGAGIAWLGMPIADLSKLDRALVVGSFLRKDHPLVAQRLRLAARKGTLVSVVNPVDDDWLMPIAQKAIAPPSRMPRLLAEIVVAAAARKGVPAPAALAGIEADDTARAIAESLADGQRAAILLGNLAEQHRDASQLLALAQALAEISGATLGCLTESANSLGAEIAGARPAAGGLDAQAMLADPRKAYLILHAEPEFDCANPVAARAALEKADFVVVMSPFRHAASYADVLLPIAPFTETAGTFVNCEGRAQKFNGVVKPLRDTRPAWKVLRVLGTLLGLPGFAFESIDDVRAECLPAQAAIDARLANRTSVAIVAPSAVANGVERVADVPIYFSDAIVRRAASLQQTADARAPRARMHRSLYDSLKLGDGAQVKVKQGRGEAVLSAVVDPAVPPGVVAVSAAHPSTCHLEGMTGAVSVERA